MKEPVIVHYLKEESVTVCNPDGVELVTTNNPLVFNDIRLQIGTKHLEGYYIIHRGKKHSIEPTGQIWPWPEGLFDKNFEFSSKLVKIMLDDE